MQTHLIVDGAVAHDVLCWSCGYDLRALPSHGRCPECGNSIAPSVSFSKWRRRSLDQADAGWLVQLIEAAGLALAVWMLVLAFSLSPEWLTQYRSPQRAVALGIACAWWTLSWLAVWKLCTPEPSPVSPNRTWPLWFVRAAATAYLITATFPAWPDGFSRRVADIQEAIVVGVALCGPLVAIGLWARVFQLGRLARCTSLQMQALILAVTSPAVLLVALSSGPNGRSSLDFMIHLPLPGLGWIEVIGFVIRYFGEVVRDRTFEWLIVLHAALGLTAMVQLLLVLIRARRRQASRSIENIEANSPP